MRGDDWIPAVVAKYRATWQFKQAVKIISPAPQRRVECEIDIIDALVWIKTSREVYSRRTPAQVRELLQKLTKTLHGAVELAGQLGPFDLRGLPIDPDAFPSRIIGELKRCLKEIEGVAGYIEVRKGARRVNDVRAAAVWKAHELLTDYSKPTRYRDGPWHELAKVLFGKRDADLFDYIEAFRPSEFPYKITVQKSD